VFESSLQLPLSDPNGNQWTIFKMLDTQPFTMTIDLLNTATDCSNITIQQNKLGVQYLFLPNRTCILQSDNATRSLSFLLPAHHTSVQINITGPYFVGGVRICLHGPGRIDGIHTLQIFDMCELFLTENETLSHMTILDMMLIKVINVTKPLHAGDHTHYTGRWIATFAENALSDELLYNWSGQSL
jgi:hypothetical protein